jgi:hypothetical protein
MGRYEIRSARYSVRSLSGKSPSVPTPEGVEVPESKDWSAKMASRYAQQNEYDLDSLRESLKPEIGKRGKPLKTPAESESETVVCLRDACSAERELGITDLPEEVQHFGQFMLRQSKKDLTALDVIKAYTITRSSVQRQALSRAKVSESWPNNPWRDQPPDSLVRPEDIYAALLMSPTGERYLRAAKKGQFDAKAAKTLADKLGGGMSNTFFLDLQFGAKLGLIYPEIEQTLRRGTKADWYNLTAKAVSGISAAKAGFWASFLGRGDLPTFDARELNYWVTNVTKPEGVETPTSRIHNGQTEWLVWSKKKQNFVWVGASSFVEPTFKLVEELGSRFRKLEVRVDPELRPFYEHLVHHAIWDKLDGVYDANEQLFKGGSRTTHSELCEVFEAEYPTRTLDGLRRKLKRKRSVRGLGAGASCARTSPWIDRALAFAGKD